MRLLGADPGHTGALALFDVQRRTLAFVDMPTNLVRTKSRKTRLEIDCAALAHAVRDLAPDHAIVEEVHAMPGQGVTSMFRFGQSYGALLGVLAACNVPVVFTSPASWKKALRVQDGKDGSRARASQIFPAYATEFRRVKDHGRADAALLAFFGQQMLDSPF